MMFTVNKVRLPEAFEPRFFGSVVDALPLGLSVVLYINFWPQLRTLLGQLDANGLFHFQVLARLPLSRNSWYFGTRSSERVLLVVASSNSPGKFFLPSKKIRLWLTEP